VRHRFPAPARHKRLAGDFLSISARYRRLWETQDISISVRYKHLCEMRDKLRCYRSRLRPVKPCRGIRDRAVQNCPPPVITIYV
jgi:hypothetical protein